MPQNLHRCAHHFFRRVIPLLFLICIGRFAQGQVVISQVYGAGGNAGAIYKNDFVELFNRGNSSVDLTGWSIQYASATGTGNLGSNSGQLAALSGSIPAGGYRLIKLAGGDNGVDLPTADVTGTIALAAGAGKVALAKISTSLGCNGGATPCNATQLSNIIDLVGYGNANFYEGSGAAPAPSATTAIFRKSNGCDDSNNNSSDFETGTPSPRNSSTILNNCTLPNLTINDAIVVEGDAGT